jgi:hypothetical protein
VQADLSAFLLETNDTVDLVGSEQVTVLGVAEAALWAVEVPEGLRDHGGASLQHSEISWKMASESRKGVSTRIFRPWTLNTAADRTDSTVAIGVSLAGRVFSGQE